MVRERYGVRPLPGKKDDDDEDRDSPGGETRTEERLPLQSVHVQELPLLNGTGRIRKGAARPRRQNPSANRRTYGAEGWNRTTDARTFNPPLYL